MSQGGQGMFATEPAVTVTGSDGKMYGSPGAARAAGVYPEPESYNQPVPMPGLSAGGKGGGIVGFGGNAETGYMTPFTPDGMTQYGPGGIGYPMGYNQPVPMPGISAGGKGGGMFTPEPAVTVIGSDGKMYGNPSAARAAGAYPEPETYNQPVPMPGISAGGKGGADPYSQIMGQMDYGSDPYSQIMGQTPDFQDPYARSSYGPSGGYDPRIYNNAFAGSNSRLNLGRGAVGGGGGGDNNQPLDPRTAAFFDKETPYAREGRMLGVNSALQGLVNFAVPGAGLFNALPGFLSSAALGRVNNALNPNGLINYDIPVEDGIPTFYTPEGRYGFVAEQPGTPALSPESQYGFVAEQFGTPAPDSGGGYSASDNGGYSGSETQSSGEAYANFNGGLVTNVFGPDPAGPDEGQVNIMRGEYVIKKSAVDKYGTGLLDMINNGKIPAKKIKSLLG